MIRFWQAKEAAEEAAFQSRCERALREEAAKEEERKGLIDLADLKLLLTKLAESEKRVHQLSQNLQLISIFLLFTLVAIIYILC
jgi:hypothetical protein